MKFMAKIWICKVQFLIVNLFNWYKDNSSLNHTEKPEIIFDLITTFNFVLYHEQ